MTVSIKKNTQVTNYEQMNTNWYFVALVIL